MALGAGSLADGPLLGLAAALGCGLLIGLERERRKRSGPDREAAGMRSFTLAALAGALARLSGEPLLVGAGALGIVVLAGIAYWRSRSSAPDADPGLTTELALVVTYLVGVQTIDDPARGAAAGVVVAALLAARDRLHRFATQALSEAELHDALMLAALALVLLPLAPAEPVAALGWLAPRKLVWLLVLILALQGAGHVALRVLGPRMGLAMSGLFSGFVSSTATVASMGARVRLQPALMGPASAGAMLSSAATWVQATLILASLAPSVVGVPLAMAVAGVLVAAAGSRWALGRHDGAGWALGGETAAGSAAGAGTGAAPGPLRVREAALVAAVLALVTVVVGWAERSYGVRGALSGAALAALADAHSGIAALGAQHAAGRIDAPTLHLGLWLAVATNAGSRSLVAFVAGGPRYGWRVALSLAASTAAAGSVLWAIS